MSGNRRAQAESGVRKRKRDEDADEEADEERLAADRHRAAVLNDDASSESNKLRAEANQLYQSLDKLNRDYVHSRLTQVSRAFKDAQSKARTPLERSRAAKNVAVVAKRALCLRRDLRGSDALDLMAEALAHYSTALVAGTSWQPLSWMGEVQGAARELVDMALGWEASQMVQERPQRAEGRPDREAVLTRLHGALPLDSSSSERCRQLAALKAKLAMAYGKCLYGEAVGIQEAGSTEQEWRRALGLVERVQPLLTTAATNAARAGEVYRQREAESLLEGTYICDAICRSTQARHAGDALLAGLLAKPDKRPSAEDLEPVADLYKQAVAHARDQDMEAEARAQLALARLYYNVIRGGGENGGREKGQDQERARCKQRAAERGIEYFKAVIHLGVAMMPRVVSNTDWFLEARQVLLKVQQEAEAADAAAAAADVAPSLEELAPEIKEIRKAAEKGAHVLLRHVYDKHPPPGLDAAFKLSDESVRGDQIKATLKKAVIAYHPDKQMTQPKRWQVLCAEIAKELTTKYQCMK